MHTTIRKIGNSKGILIPAPLLAACDIHDEVEMRVENNRIVIEPVSPKLRQDWFIAYSAEADHDAWANLQETAAEQDEWEW